MLWEAIQLYQVFIYKSESSSTYNRLLQSYRNDRARATDLSTSGVSSQPQKSTNMQLDRKGVRMSPTSFVNFYLLPLLDSIKQIDKIISPSFLAAQPSLSVDAL